MDANFLYNPDGFSGHSHSSSIAEHDGKIYCAWYAYEEKEHERGQICITSKSLEATQWPKAKFIFEDLKSSSCGNPVIFSHGGSLHLYFVILKRSYWDSSIIYYSKLEDDSKWSTPRVVTGSFEGLMIRHRPYIVNDVAYIPAYDEKTMTTIVYESQSSNLGEWRKYSELEDHYIQGDILSFDQRQWHMYLRAAGDNEYVMKAMSPNSGKTWSTTNKTTLPCPLSGIAAISLQNGDLIVCNNHTEEHKRNPISISLSKSKGVDFEYGPWDVDSMNIELSYPTLLQDSTGRIHLAYTYNRKMIKWISLSQEDLVERMEGLKNA